jgi:hypothetical protein
MAYGADVSPIKTSIEEESHSSASKVTPQIIFTEAPTVPLLSLDELPILYYDFNFDIECMY